MWVLYCFVQALVCTGSSAQVNFNLVNSETVRSRLDQYKGTDVVRELALRKIFIEAGCLAPNLVETPVPKRKEPNVICVLPGETPQTILVGAHFDHVPEGDGIVDNWSGASLLPSLLQSLMGVKRKHTFVFAGFTGEEAGEVGSSFFVSHLSDAQASQIGLMITLDKIGRGQTKGWASRADKVALGLLIATAHAASLPIAGMNVDGYGESDEEPFIKRKIKTITLHSLTPATSHVIHTSKDAPAAISFQDYYDTYHLLAAYLAVADTRLESGAVEAK